MCHISGFELKRLKPFRYSVKTLNVIAYGALVVLGAQVLLVLGAVVHFSLKPKPEFVKPLPIAAREIVKQSVGGSEEELWIIKTDKDVLRIPAKYVGYHDPDSGFYHLNFYWPGLDPITRNHEAAHTSSELVQVLLYAKRDRPLLPIEEYQVRQSKLYGDPQPIPGNWACWSTQAVECRESAGFWPSTFPHHPGRVGHFSSLATLATNVGLTLKTFMMPV